MSEKTHAEIIADMRYKAGVICPCQVNGGTCELCPLGHSTHGKDLWKYCSFHKLAHELDAAHKREIDELKKQVGDCAKLREACAKAAESAAEIMERVRHKDGLAFNTANYIAGVARTALAAPPRNCDVGSAEEQEDRFRRYCNSRGTFCGDCPLYNNRRGECRFVWGQMPYVEKEGGAE